MGSARLILVASSIMIATSTQSARSLWLRARPSIVGMLVMAAVLLYVQYSFSTLVAPQLLRPWLIGMWACIVVFSVTVSALLLPRLRAGLSAAFFIRVGEVVALGLCFGIVVSVWILMPPADEPLRMLMVLLCMWFIAMVIVLNPNAASIYGALAVVASMASFVVVYEMKYGWALAGFLIGEGAALVAIRRLIWRAADRFEAAHQIATAERDAKTRFIASASHDLQQPVQAAWMFAENALHATNDISRARATSGMRNSFASVQALLESMLDHLRLEAGAVVVRRESVALDGLVHEVLGENLGAAEAAGLKFHNVHSSLDVLADRALLKRALTNLVVNAIRHSDARKLLIGARLSGEIVTLWVIDDGRGIAPSEHARLFDDYTRGTEEEGATQGGFGIGLASVRRIVGLLAGRAYIDPRWKDGAAFALCLPQSHTTVVRCKAA